MPIPEHLVAHPAARYFRDGNPYTKYWFRGDAILYGDKPLKGADITSFRFYVSGWGKDHKNCYCGGSRLTGGNGATFRALNYAFATDGNFVWTLGGKIADVDAESFEVCDDGVRYLDTGTMIPSGYGKDKARVYCEDFYGKAKWVRKASPSSFVSLNDGQFGKDENFVFYFAAVIPKADPAQWRPLGSAYSKDDRRVYYCNRAIPDADSETFEFVEAGSAPSLAKDKSRFYENGSETSETWFHRKLRESDGSS